MYAIRSYYAVARQERRKRLESLVFPIDHVEEAARRDVAEGFRIAEDDEHGLVRPEATAHRLFDGGDGRIQIFRRQQLQGQRVDPGDSYNFV